MNADLDAWSTKALAKQRRGYDGSAAGVLTNNRRDSLLTTPAQLYEAMA